MVQLIFSLLMGLALLAALYVLVFPSPRARRGGEAIIGARQALTTLQLDLLPPEFVSRLFSAEDFDYVAAASSEDTRRRCCTSGVMLAGRAKTRRRPRRTSSDSSRRRRGERVR